MERLRSFAATSAAPAPSSRSTFFCIVTAVVGTLSLQRAFFRRQRRLSETLQPTLMSSLAS
jgi:hypothetical protein